jgi:hypothetical protein
MNVSAKEPSQPNRSNLAKTLNMNVDTIKQKRDLLIGIWPKPLSSCRIAGRPPMQFER